MSKRLLLAALLAAVACSFALAPTPADAHGSVVAINQAYSPGTIVVRTNAAAMTLAGSEYAIHGTNQPGSIGHFVSYGCIRMFNEDITDLFGRVSVGTEVVVQ
jgi:hypothetical protein